MQKRELPERWSCQKEGAGWVERAGGGFKKKNVLIRTRERERYRERERHMRERVRVGEGGGCAWKDKACEDVIRKNGSF